jgi:cation transport ATPase
MKQSRTGLIDTLGLGGGLWLLGYVCSLVLFFTPLKSIMGWILFALFTPVTAWVAYRVFRSRQKAFRYCMKVAASWLLIAIILDYFFIIVLFANNSYYASDVFAYYAATFLIPLLVGYTYRKR